MAFFSPILNLRPVWDIGGPVSQEKSKSQQPNHLPHGGFGCVHKVCTQWFILSLTTVCCSPVSVRSSVLFVISVLLISLHPVLSVNIFVFNHSLSGCSVMLSNEYFLIITNTLSLEIFNCLNVVFYDISFNQNSRNGHLSNPFLTCVFPICLFWVFHRGGQSHGWELCQLWPLFLGHSFLLCSSLRE